MFVCEQMLVNDSYVILHFLDDNLQLLYTRKLSDRTIPAWKYENVPSVKRPMRYCMRDRRGVLTKMYGTASDTNMCECPF